MESADFILNHSIAQGLEVIGDRWTLLILRDCFLGRHRFEEFRRNIGISKATLVRRLERLIAEGIVVKKPYSEHSNRFEYRLTQKGNALYPASLLAWQWEVKWCDHEQDLTTEKPSKQLVHASCQHKLIPKAVCAHCNDEFTLSDIELASKLVNKHDQLLQIKSISKQRRVRVLVNNDQYDPSLTTVSDLIGDRWTLLILIAAFLGVNRYDDFLSQLKIASNILSARLKLLSESGVFTKHHYQSNPPRYEYKLTAKGNSLYMIVMTLRDWVIRWSNNPEYHESLIHSACNQPLKIVVQCSHCGHCPDQSDVFFK